MYRLIARWYNSLLRGVQENIVDSIHTDGSLVILDKWGFNQTVNRSDVLTIFPRKIRL